MRTTNVDGRRRLPRRAAVIAVSLGLALSGAGAAWAAVPAASSAALPVAGTSADNASLIKAYAAFEKIPAAAVGAVRSGSVHIADVTSTGTEWATAAFTANPADSAAVQSRFQDGNAIGVFTRQSPSNWTMRGVGGEPFPCASDVPTGVVAAWGLSTAACGAATGTPATARVVPQVSQATAGTGTTSTVASVAIAQIGRGDTPATTNFNDDCNPYTALLGVGASHSGCGTDPNFGVVDQNELWCADFAKWVWEQAGVTADLSVLNAGATSFATWGSDQGESTAFDTGTAAIGDAIVFYPSGTSKAVGTSADHVGLIIGVNSSNNTVRMVNGDFQGSSNITVQDSGYVNIQSFANSVWGNGEKWVLVSPKLPTAELPGAPALYDPKSGNFEVYAVGTDATLREDYWTGSAWSGFKNIGGSITGFPSAVYDSVSGNLEVYATGTNGALDEFYWNGSQWGAKSLGGAIVGSPSALVDSLSGDMEIYAVGKAGDLEVDSWNPSSGWSGLQSLTGTSTVTLASSPAAVNDVANTATEVYATDSSGNLEVDSWTPASGWSGLQSLGGPVQGTPSPLSDKDTGNQEVYVTGANGNLESDALTSSGWVGLKSLSSNNTVVGSPSALNDTASGNTEAYVTGSGGDLDEDAWTASGGWHGLDSLGGSIKPSPTAVYDPVSGNMEVYAAGTDGSLTEYHWNGKSWSAATELAGTITISAQ